MKKVAIIGGGLAGTACAYVLQRQGLKAVIYEAGDDLASGASGNTLGLVNPRLSAERTPISAYYSAAFTIAVRTFSNFQNVEWRQCGALHLMNDEKKTIRFQKTAKNWGWPKNNMRLVDAKEASQIAGVNLSHAALFLADAGSVNPQMLCRKYTQHSDIKIKNKIVSLSDVEADFVILACGMAVEDFSVSSHLPLKSVRGQVTEIASNVLTKNIKVNLCYGGYCSPAYNGVHTCGATFQRWLDHNDIMDEDDDFNIMNLKQVLSINDSFEVKGHRAGIRTTSPDHFPIVGHIGESEGRPIYVSTGHGSHGIISSLLSAYVLGAEISGRVIPLPRSTYECLSPHRFG